MQNIQQARAAMESGLTSSVELVEACLARIEDPAGQGRQVFTRVYREEALASARASDRERRSAGQRLPLCGIPISIKDLFDVAGETTTAGSRVLGDAPPAATDAVAVARLRSAGAIIVGKTNMSEFAFSGIGLNPHYGTPLAPFNRALGYVPGGSSSGCAVSVTDEMALATIGTDTGGSARIPAAFCGLVGFKPTRGRVPTSGAFPLAPSFDVVGPMARTVADCRLLDSVLSGRAHQDKSWPLRTLKFAVSGGLPMAGLDPQVGAAFGNAVGALDRSGAQIRPLGEFDWDAPIGLALGGRISAVECLATHGALFERASEYDPLVATRIAAAQGFPAADYLRALWALTALRDEARARLGVFDAVLMPTVARLPPTISEVSSAEPFFAANSLILRNTMLANLLDLCAISVPIPGNGGLPVGLMLISAGGRDVRLFDAAEWVQSALAAQL